MKRLLQTGMLLALAIGGVACRTASDSAEMKPAGPCEIALAAHGGEAGIDKEIAAIQQDLRVSRKPYQTNAMIEQLGWRFVEKARGSFDPGYYKLAEQCALCLESKPAKSDEEARSPLSSARSIRAASLLLRGHALHSMHRFAEAEKLARELVETRGLAYDFGLLGDVLMEQGKLDESIAAYEKMMEQRPGPQAYSRAAHIRWLKGDLDGARILMRMAAQSAGDGDADSSAWAWARLALFELQAGNAKRAHEMCDLALELRGDYAPALLARGRVLLAEKRIEESLAPLQKAAGLNPLPEYLWTLADALRGAGRNDEAERVEARLAATGPSNDPRTFALYLATRGSDAATALKLAEEEFRLRRDIYTLDALAWAQLAAGNAAEAWKTMRAALAQNTQDARLFLHAATIASQAGDMPSAKRYAGKAARIDSLLLPGERIRLRELGNS
ncbi:MAG: tetratricopeptide repeat protein [Blastocatellia bacterium]